MPLKFSQFATGLTGYRQGAFLVSLYGVTLTDVFQTNFKIQWAVGWDDGGIAGTAITQG
jgi:hypothetical protein